MLRVYALIDRNPPFTTNQLEALVIPEVFPIIDWPAIFNVRETPLREALIESYLDPRYCRHCACFLEGLSMVKTVIIGAGAMGSGGGALCAEGGA